MILVLTALTHATYCFIPNRNFVGSWDWFISSSAPLTIVYSFKNSSNNDISFLSIDALTTITCFNFGSLASINLKMFWIYYWLNLKYYSMIIRRHWKLNSEYINQNIISHKGLKPILYTFFRISHIWIDVHKIHFQIITRWWSTIKKMCI